MCCCKLEIDLHTYTLNRKKYCNEDFAWLEVCNTNIISKYDGQFGDFNVINITNCSNHFISNYNCIRQVLDEH